MKKTTPTSQDVTADFNAFVEAQTQVYQTLDLGDGIAAGKAFMNFIDVYSAWCGSLH